MIKLASPDIRPEDIARAVSVIESGNLVQGANVVAFEEALCDFSRLPASAVVSSGTAALHLALVALGIKAGDIVIVPAFTFPATANVVEAVGADILLCDVGEKSYLMEPAGLEELILANREKNIKAVIVVHEFGCPAEMARIAAICDRYGLKLVEDAACALGTMADGFHAGYYSDMACFSFHPRKAITTGEGGALLSINRELMERIRIFRNHGIQIADEVTDFVAAGLNYRMTDFQAALAIGQLERFASELERRRRLALSYGEKLADVRGVRLPAFTDGHSWQSFMVLLDEGIDRSKLIAMMGEKGVQVNLGAQALNCLSYYMGKYKVGAGDFPVATRLYRSGLVLPLYGKITESDIDMVCNLLAASL